MSWRAVKRSMFWLRAALLLFAVSRFVAAHEEARPVYAMSGVYAVIHNNLFNLRSP